VPLQISLVEHAADLKIDEQEPCRRRDRNRRPNRDRVPTGPPVTVDLDRPYLLLLRDDTSGAILFVARVPIRATAEARHGARDRSTLVRLRQAIRVHTLIYRATFGLIGHRFRVARRCFCSTTSAPGAPSSERHRWSMFVTPNVVLIASKGGYPRHPAWFHNLVAHPDTTFRSARATWLSGPGSPILKNARDFGRRRSRCTPDMRPTASAPTARSRS